MRSVLFVLLFASSLMAQVGRLWPYEGLRTQSGEPRSSEYGVAFLWGIGDMVTIRLFGIGQTEIHGIRIYKGAFDGGGDVEVTVRVRNAEVVRGMWLHIDHTGDHPTLASFGNTPPPRLYINIPFQTPGLASPTGWTDIEIEVTDARNWTTPVLPFGQTVAQYGSTSSMVKIGSPCGTTPAQWSSSVNALNIYASPDRISFTPSGPGYPFTTFVLMGAYTPNVATVLADGMPCQIGVTPFAVVAWTPSASTFSIPMDRALNGAVLAAQGVSVRQAYGTIGYVMPVEVHRLELSNLWTVFQSETLYGTNRVDRSNSIVLESW